MDAGDAFLGKGVVFVLPQGYVRNVFGDDVLNLPKGCFAGLGVELLALSVDELVDAIAVVE